MIATRASLLMQSYPMAPPPPQKELDAYYRYVREAAIAMVGETVSLAKEHGVQARPEVLEVSSSVVRGISDYASNEKVDLIVMGTRGLGGFKRMLVGSVSGGMVSHACGPILIVR